MGLGGSTLTRRTGGPSPAEVLIGAGRRGAGVGPVRGVVPPLGAGDVAADVPVEGATDVVVDVGAELDSCVAGVVVVVVVVGMDASALINEKAMVFCCGSCRV